MLKCEKCNNECFAVCDENNNAVSSCCKVPFSDAMREGLMGEHNHSQDYFQKSNPESG